MTRYLLLIPVAVLFWPGCRKETPAPQAQSRKETPAPQAQRPRIVSFSPALTQITFDMGLGGNVVGVTRYCVLPAGQNRPVLGDAYNVSGEAILALHPDVVLIQQAPEAFEGVRRRDPSVRIVHFEIETLADIASAMEQIGRIAGREELGKARKEQFLDELASLRSRVPAGPPPRVLFTDGHEPPLVAGRGTFIHQMIELAGGVNAASRYKGWTTLNKEVIQAAAPDVLICRTDAGREDAVKGRWMSLPELPAARTGRVYIVTERDWTIPSGRTAKMARKLFDMIHAKAATRAAR